MKIKLLMVPLMALTVTGCVSVTDKTDKKTGINIQTVAVRGCGNPSQTMTWVKRPGKKESSFASTGADLCNTGLAAALGAAGQIGAAAVLPKSAGIANTVISGSQANSNQTSTVTVRP